MFNGKSYLTFEAVMVLRAHKSGFIFSLVEMAVVSLVKNYLVTVTRTKSCEVCIGCLLCTHCI